MGQEQDKTARPRRFHTETFERAEPDKRERVLQAALSMFASRGFHGASINELAKTAGISIGSLYSYFPSKEDLFLSVVDAGHALLEEALSKLDADAPFFTTFELLLRAARDYAKAKPELNLVYLEATTQGVRHLAEKLSGSLEAVTVGFYHRALKSAVKRGELRKDMDVGAAAFCIDNLLLLFQFSFASDYYRDRLELFLGRKPGTGLGDEETLIAHIVDFARRALGAA